MTPSQKAARSEYLPLIRGLVSAYNAFNCFDGRKLKKHDLTIPQADVIFTLGNTDGMTYKEIGNKTLTSKGTLTGIIDRLEQKGIVSKCVNEKDARSQIVSLTTMGDKMFQTIFPQHINELENALKNIDKKTRNDLTEKLVLLSNTLNQH